MYCFCGYETAKCGSRYFLVSTVKQICSCNNRFYQKQHLFSCVISSLCGQFTEGVALSVQFTEYSKSRCILKSSLRLIGEQMD